MKTIFCVLEFNKFEGSKNAIKKSFSTNDSALEFIEELKSEFDGDFMNEFYIQEVELCDVFVSPKWIELTPTNKPEFGIMVCVKTYTGEVMQSCYRKSEKDNDINLFDCEVDGLGTVKYFRESLYPNN